MSSNLDLRDHSFPKSVVIGSYVALLVLTAVMVGLSRLNVAQFNVDWMDLHAFKACLIMGTALVMGIIVSMFLMGLRYESKLLNLTIFLSNFVFLLIFVLFTWVDTSFRGEVDPSFAESIDFTSPVKVAAPGAGGHGAAGMEPSHEAAPAPAAAPATAPAAAPADSAKSAAPADSAKKAAPAPAAAH